MGQVNANACASTLPGRNAAGLENSPSYARPRKVGRRRRSRTGFMLAFFFVRATRSGTAFGERSPAPMVSRSSVFGTASGGRSRASRVCGDRCAKLASRRSQARPERKASRRPSRSTRLNVSTVGAYPFITDVTRTRSMRPSRRLHGARGPLRRRIGLRKPGDTPTTLDVLVAYRVPPRTRRCSVDSYPPPRRRPSGSHRCLTPSRHSPPCG